MFDVGFSEILLIAVIALIVLGPKKLPKLAQDIGRWVGRARAMARQLRSQLDQEVAAEDFGLNETKSSRPAQAAPPAPTPPVATSAPPPVQDPAPNVEAAPAPTATVTGHERTGT